MEFIIEGAIKKFTVSVIEFAVSCFNAQDNPKLSNGSTKPINSMGISNGYD
jgi:hypothetical protein